RADQIAMAKDWLNILSATPTPWGIPSNEVSELRTLTDSADELWKMTLSSDRTTIITAECKTAFNKLAVKMRAIKNHYFLSPPLSNVDLISLKLKPKDYSRTPSPPPANQAEADLSRPGEHQIMLHLRAVATEKVDPRQGDYGFRIYWGIMPTGGATIENALSAKRELVKIPVSGEELPHSRFTRRKKELFDFSQEDRGKTIFFCIRFENAKGEPGPWGPLFSTIIP
ncbi:MAG: hypothetical protein LBG58_13755, partial [Planctomycetaceae bacterium]|nr:hypothetical protein [Planctomycetaceae bacterium]